MVIAACLMTTPVFADTEDFDVDKLMSDLESQLKLSSDKLSKMKPAIDAKSKELKADINKSVEEGFMQMETLTGQLDAASKEAEAKLEEALNSEEIQELKAFLGKIDKEAINQIRQDLVTELTDFLKLTENQIMELKPVLEEGINELGEMLSQLAKEGNKSLEEFKSRYEKLNKEFDLKIKDALDSDQIKSLDKHQDELREKIKSTLYSA